MEPPDERVKEAGLHIRSSGLDSSKSDSSLPHHLYKEKIWQRISFHSICIVTILRLVVIQRLDYEDLSYYTIMDSMLIALEPTLGIINAFSPILQPVISKYSKKSIFRWYRLGTSNRFISKGRLWPFTSSKSAANSGDFEAKHFRSVDGEVYPLTDLNATCDSISGPGGDRNLRH